jgi:DNA-binding transcriptional ArsR family regulator
MAVGEIAELLPVTRPAVSQHLKVLKHAGLVTDLAIGTRRIYRVRSDGLRSIHAYLDQMWGQALAGFEAAAQRLAAQQATDDERRRQTTNDRRNHEPGDDSAGAVRVDGADLG